MAAERMRMLTPDGVEVITTAAGSNEASLIGRHWNAIQQFLHTGDMSQLTLFAGVRINGRPLAVDPGGVERWAHRGELDFEDIYEDGSS